ncbi:MAG: response regulator transcription factor [Verrucomicrobia bacterium]|nr:response regulator transcription factor [Verrucomicrobiota bacterium]
MHGQTKVLIVEDDNKTADALRRGLCHQGYQVTLKGNGNEGLDELRSQFFHLAILDWMLPGMDGIEILLALRAQKYRPPVLLLTACDALEDRVLGLDSGADDYLVKPFAFVELLARLRALLRRNGVKMETATQHADLNIDLIARRAWRADEELQLTPREFELLAFLLRHQGQIVSRSMLMHEVWRESNRMTSLDNVIDVHLARLRKKVDGERRHRLIHTVRGVGFVLREAASA